jgi:hypothetical protein
MPTLGGSAPPLSRSRLPAAAPAGCWQAGAGGVMQLHSSAQCDASLRSSSRSVAAEAGERSSHALEAERLRSPNRVSWPPSGPSTNVVYSDHLGGAGSGATRRCSAAAAGASGSRTPSSQAWAMSSRAEGRRSGSVASIAFRMSTACSDSVSGHMIVKPSASACA